MPTFLVTIRFPKIDEIQDTGRMFGLKTKRPVSSLNITSGAIERIQMETSNIERIQMKTQEFEMNTDFQLAEKDVRLSVLNEVLKEAPWELD